MEEKIKVLNLLPLTLKMIEFLEETFPMHSMNLREEPWQYVKFYKGNPYFYSTAYIESHSADELVAAFLHLGI